MRKNNLLLLALILCLAACSTYKIKDPIVPTDIRVVLDPRSLEPCKPLVPLTPREPGLAVDHYDILANLTVNVSLYRECANKQNTSIELLKQFSNR